MSEFKRINNESFRDYFLRMSPLCRKKGYNWIKLSNIYNQLTGNDFAPDTWRKWYARETRPEYKAATLLPENIDFIMDDISETQEDVLEEIRKERIKIQTLNLERSRYDRERARHELYYDYVKSAITSLPLPEFQEISINESNRKKYLVTISDCHYGAEFHSEHNDYSPEIFKWRLGYASSKIIEFIKDKGLSEIWITSLGDDIQGILRCSDLKINQSSIVKATVDFSRLIALFLSKISEYCKVHYYHVGTSNHTQLRPLGTKANQLADEDIEYVIGNYIKDLCSNNERIDVNIAADEGSNFIKIDGLGYNVYAAHGHNFKNIETALRDVSMLKYELIDYLFVGHWHSGKNIPSHESLFNDCEVIVSPSIVGSDPYSDSILKGCKPAIGIYGFDEIDGCNETYKIILH